MTEQFTSRSKFLLCALKLLFTYLSTVMALKGFWICNVQPGINYWCSTVTVSRRWTVHWMTSCGTETYFLEETTPSWLHLRNPSGYFVCLYSSDSQNVHWVIFSVAQFLNYSPMRKHKTIRASVRPCCVRTSKNVFSTPCIVVLETLSQDASSYIDLWELLHLICSSMDQRNHIFAGVEIDEDRLTNSAVILITHIYL